MSNTSEAIASATAENSSFSRRLPGLQIAVDSTSLGVFKTCPRKYQYSIIFGWRSREESPHLTFGILLHKAREQYDHLRSQSTPHEEALAAVVRWTLNETWD